MKTIWKYIVPVGTYDTLEVPTGAKFLDTQVQGGLVAVWALVDPAAPRETRTPTWYGTGHEHPDIPGEYVGTVQLQSGALVFHLFIE